MTAQTRKTLIRAAIWAAAAIALWWIADATRLHTDVEIVSDGSTLRWTVAGTSVELPVIMQRVESVGIVARDSIDPPGGRYLEITDGDGRTSSIPLPRRLYLPTSPHEPVGDWFVDQGFSQHQVAHFPVELESEFTIRARLLGRPLQAMTLRLYGRPSFDFQFRRGLLNNDLGVATVEGEGIVQEGLSPRPAGRLAAAVSTLLRTASIACALAALAFALSCVHLGERWTASVRFSLSDRASLRIALTFAVTAAVLSGVVATGVLEGLPHVPDSVAYLLQAKWLLDGRITGEVNEVSDHFRIPFTHVFRDRWISQYPPMWPAILAAGEALGLPWLLSPLLGGVATLLLYLVGKELYSTAVGLTAALLSLLSPMTTLINASLMSHAAAATCILLFVWLLLVARRRASPGIPAVAAGIALGVGFGIRPLTAIAVVLPVGLWLLAGLGTLGRRKHGAALLVAVAVGGILGTLPTLAANHHITGSATAFPYSMFNRDAYGLGNLAVGIRNLDTLLTVTLPSLHGWGWGLGIGAVMLPLSLAFAWLPFLLRRWRSADLLLAAIFAAVVAAHLGTQFHGVHGYGARYYFEVLFCLFLLTARGFEELARSAARAGSRAVSMASATAVGSLAVALLASTALTMPLRLGLYRGYNYVDGRLEAQVRQLGVERALVIFRSTRWFHWGRAANLMSGDPEGDLVFAARLDDDTALLEHYHDRPVYHWRGTTLEPNPTATDAADLPADPDTSTQQPVEAPATTVAPQRPLHSTQQN